ncbi:hypothetical protein PSm6_48710 [Pseudomonas solani]|uniref:Uncharacterized protein n=1 Tax=Pseudomonas solani TaxID=2731552 RepID=A0ABN6C0R2_9PSED|nr:hypothetical protein PSm6_48710 [Pseudomonas solani]
MAPLAALHLKMAAEAGASGVRSRAQASRAGVRLRGERIEHPCAGAAMGEESIHWLEAPTAPAATIAPLRLRRPLDANQEARWLAELS